MYQLIIRVQQQQETKKWLCTESDSVYLEPGAHSRHMGTAPVYTAREEHFVFFFKCLRKVPSTRNLLYFR